MHSLALHTHGGTKENVQVLWFFFVLKSIAAHITQNKPGWLFPLHDHVQTWVNARLQLFCITIAKVSSRNLGLALFWHVCISSSHFPFTVSTLLCLCTLCSSLTDVNSECQSQHPRGAVKVITIKENLSWYPQCSIWEPFTQQSSIPPRRRWRDYCFSKPLR